MSSSRVHRPPAGGDESLAELAGETRSPCRGRNVLAVDDHTETTEGADVHTGPDDHSGSGLDRAGDEPFDLVHPGVDVTDVVEVVDAGSFDERRAGDGEGQPSTPLDGNGLIAGSMQDEGGDIEGRQDFAHIHVERELQEITQRVRARCVALVPLVPVAKRLIAGQRRGEQVDDGGLGRSPRPGEGGLTFPPLGGVLLVLAVGNGVGERARQDDALYPLRIRGGEEECHRSSLRCPEEMGGTDAGVVHHGPEIIDPLIETRYLAAPIRAAGPALVEVHVTTERSESLEHRTERGPLPSQFDVLRHRRDRNDRRRPFEPEPLIREPPTRAPAQTELAEHLCDRE